MVEAVAVVVKAGFGIKVLSREAVAEEVCKRAGLVDCIAEGVVCVLRDGAAVCVEVAGDVAVVVVARDIEFGLRTGAGDCASVRADSPVAVVEGILRTETQEQLATRHDHMAVSLSAAVAASVLCPHGVNYTISEPRPIVCMRKSRLKRAGDYGIIFTFSVGALYHVRLSADMALRN